MSKDFKIQDIENFMTDEEKNIEILPNGDVIIEGRPEGKSKILQPVNRKDSTY